jgi:hypothetical protein
MGTEPRDFPQQVAREPRVRREKPNQRGSECDPLELNEAVGKKLDDLPSIYPTYIGVPGLLT